MPVASRRPFRIRRPIPGSYLQQVAPWKQSQPKKNIYYYQFFGWKPTIIFLIIISIIIICKRRLSSLFVNINSAPTDIIVVSILRNFWIWKRWYQDIKKMHYCHTYAIVRIQDGAPEL